MPTGQFPVPATCTAVLTGTTGADGSLTFSDLALGKCVVVETKAPAGFVLPTNPVSAVQNLTDPAPIVNMIITNEKAPLTQLPLTGSSGRAVVTVAGALLVLFAFTGVMLLRRRTN